MKWCTQQFPYLSEVSEYNYTANIDEIFVHQNKIRIIEFYLKICIRQLMILMSYTVNVEIFAGCYFCDLVGQTFRVGVNFAVSNLQNYKFRDVTIFVNIVVKIK